MSSFTQEKRPHKKEYDYKPRKGRGKVKKTHMALDPYENLETHTPIDINPFPMITGKNFDVDSQIEKDKRIDPAKVFENYKEPKKEKKKKDKNTKKISRIDKKPIEKKFTVKYGI